MSETILGIDLGTTNSLVAVVQKGQPVILADASGCQLLPSMVGISPTGEVLIGEQAQNQYHVYPERTIKSVKRLMGTDQQINLADQQFSPQEISAMILRELKRIAEQALGESLSKAVITVPAYFNEAQRQATLEAGRIAGLEVVRLLNEPTAAALCYETSTQRQRALVCDLGGGTVDISIVDMEDGVVQVLASHGDTHLGGDDFDQLIVDLIIQQIEQQTGLNLAEREDSVLILARLARAAQHAKEQLSDLAYVTIAEEFLFETDGIPFNLQMELSRETYEQALMPYMERILDAAQMALSSAGLTVADIDEILLVGGASRTPLLAYMLAAETGQQATTGLQPDLSVALGAAIQAGMLAGESVNSVLVDVTPYSFGTRVIGELDGVPYPALFSPIIKRNTPIPVTRSEIFYTAEDKQSYVDLKIYQGEDENALLNTLIGEFKIEGLRKVRYKNAVVVELSLDTNGVLNVTATEKETGLSKSIVIENASPRLSDSEITTAQQRMSQLQASNTMTSLHK